VCQQTTLPSEYLKKHCNVCLYDDKDVTVPSNKLSQTSICDQKYHASHQYLAAQEFDYLLPALLYCSNNLDSFTNTQQFQIFNCLSVTYDSYGLNNESHNARLTSLEIEGISEDDFPKSTILADVARKFLLEENYESALIAFEHILENDNVVDQGLLQTLHTNIGICYYNQEVVDYQKAEYHLREGLHIALDLSDSLEVAISYTNLGDLYFDQYRSDLAQVEWEMALGIAKRNNYLEALEVVYYNLHFMYSEDENYEMALYYNQKYIETKEKVWEKNQTWEIAKREREMAAAAREDEIAQSEIVKEIQASDIAKKTTQRNGFILLTLLAVIGGSIIYWLYRSKRKMNQVIVKQNEELGQLNTTKDRLFSVIGHDLRSPILSLKQRSETLITEHSGELSNEGLEAAKANKQALFGMHKMIENVLLWGQAQQQNTEGHFQRLNLKRLLEQVLEDYKELLQHKEIQLMADVPNNSYIVADMHCTKAVLRNVLDNAIKYNDQKGRILISYTQKADQCILIVENDGKTIDPKTIEQLEKGKRTKNITSNGLGLWICRDMMLQNEGSFSIQATSSTTRVELHFKMKEHAEN